MDGKKALCVIPLKSALTRAVIYLLLIGEIIESTHLHPSSNGSERISGIIYRRLSCAPVNAMLIASLIGASGSHASPAALIGWHPERRRPLLRGENVFFFKTDEKRPARWTLGEADPQDEPGGRLSCADNWFHAAILTLGSHKIL